MTVRRVPSAALVALLVLGGGVATGCGEDSVYDKDDGATVEDTTRPTPEVSNPGLANAGTASPIPTRTDDVGIGGEERTGGDPAD